jgi:hypothetical protein
MMLQLRHVLGFWYPNFVSWLFFFRKIITNNLFTRITIGLRFFGKGLFALGKGFGECRTRQRTLRKKNWSAKTALPSAFCRALGAPAFGKKTAVMAPWPLPGTLPSVPCPGTRQRILCRVPTALALGKVLKFVNNILCQVPQTSHSAKLYYFFNYILCRVPSTLALSKAEFF